MLNYPLLYLEHLSDHDLELITQAAGHDDPTSLRTRVAERPEVLDQLLGEPSLYDAIFAEPDQPIGVRATPFLAFGVLINRTSHDLGAANYVYEWAGPRKRLPVFDVAALQGFVADGVRRYFLIELLTSFTKVASGSIWVRSRRGYRRRRFSELDPVRLAEMVDHLPEAQRPAGYRRLGDVALFLSGIFPDHTAGHPFAPFERELLARSAGIRASLALHEGRDLGFHEAAGAGWYRRAVETAEATIGAGPEFLLDVADHFQQARRVLNFVADRYLYRFDPGLIRPN